MSKPLIVFQYYKSRMPPSFKIPSGPPQKADDDEPDFDGLDDDDDDDESDYPYPDRDKKLEIRTEPFAILPDGLLPVKEYMATPEIYRMYMGYTNFNITKEIIDIIDDIDGIEALEYLTRYRVRVAIGKLFKPQDVLADITKKIKEYFEAIDEASKL